MGGNKGANKAPRPREESGSVTLPPAAPANYRDTLVPEDQVEYDRKLALNTAKAKCSQARSVADNNYKRQKEAAAQKRERKNQRLAQHEAAKEAVLDAKAKEEGIVKAQQNDEGTWCVETATGPEPALNQYFCTYCCKHLNKLVLVDHMANDLHKKKRIDTIGPACAFVSATSADPLVTLAAVQTIVGGPTLEEWQEPSEWGPRCKPCSLKYINASHLATKDHTSRLESWLEQTELKKQGYPAPPEPYFAYVPSDDGWKVKMCLLCSKPGKIGTEVWDGGHSIAQLHNTRLSQYGCYANDIVKVKLRFHPVLARVHTPTPARSSAVRGAQASAAHAWLGGAELEEEVLV